MLELVPISLKEANAFVAQHHRHHKPVVGHKFSVAAAVDEGAKLRAVKKAKRKDRERPVSEMLLMMFRSAARDRKKGHI